MKWKAARAFTRQVTLKEAIDPMYNLINTRRKDREKPLSFLFFARVQGIV